MEKMEIVIELLSLGSAGSIAHGCRSVASGSIDEVVQRLSCVRSPPLRRHAPRDAGDVEAPRSVWRDRDRWVTPERMILWQRLDAERVECRRRDVAAVEQLDQVRVDDVMASREIDQRCSPGKQVEPGAIEHVLRLWRERREIDENLGAG
jgi:hypothetical protein